MKSKYVTVNDTRDIAAFANYALAVDGDVLVKRGVYVIDGKSIMGLYSIDLSQGACVEYPETAKEFDEFLDKFI